MADTLEKLLINYKESNKKLVEMEAQIRKLRKDVALKRHAI